MSFPVLLLRSASSVTSSSPFTRYAPPSYSLIICCLLFPVLFSIQSSRNSRLIALLYCNCSEPFGFLQLRQPAFKGLLRKQQPAMVNSTLLYALSSKCFGLAGIVTLYCNCSEPFGFLQLRQPAFKGLLRKQQPAMVNSTLLYALSSKCFGLAGIVTLYYTLNLHIFKVQRRSAESQCIHHYYRNSQQYPIYSEGLEIMPLHIPHQEFYGQH